MLEVLLLCLHPQSPSEAGMYSSARARFCSMLGGRRACRKRHGRQAARPELGMKAGTVHTIHVVFCFLIPSLHAEKKRG